jgi:hypothetical protein
VRQARAEIAASAAALSGARRAAAGQLRVAVEACLADLAMAGSRFDVRIGWLPDPKARLTFVHAEKTRTARFFVGSRGLLPCCEKQATVRSTLASASSAAPSTTPPCLRSSAVGVIKPRSPVWYPLRRCKQGRPRAPFTVSGTAQGKAFCRALQEMLKVARFAEQRVCCSGSGR